MIDRLPNAVVVTELPDGVRYRLPSRPRGLVSRLAWGTFIGCSLAIVATSFFLWMLTQAPGPSSPVPGFDGSVWMISVCVLWMLGMALWFAGRSLTRIFRHSEIELRGGTMRGIECWGWLYCSWQRSVAGLRRFEVRDALPDERAGRVYEERRLATEYNVIVPIWHEAEPEDKFLQLACGYPRDWLVPLASDLARRCQRAAAPAITVHEEPLPNKAGFVEECEQPPDSKLRVDRAPDELRIIGPRSHEALTVRNGCLIAEWSRWFGGVAKQQWTSRQLVGIRVGRILQNDGPDRFEVLIDPYPGEGKRFRVGSDSEAEARWVATLLRQALRMPDVALSDIPPFLERAEQPARSRIIHETGSEGLRLLVPAMGLGHPNVRYYMGVSLAFLLGNLVASPLIYLFTQSGLLLHANWFGWLFQCLLWCLPVLLGLSCIGAIEEVIKRAHRHAVLTLAGATLAIQQTNLYRTWRQEWSCSRIKDIHVGHTKEGTTKNAADRQITDDNQDPTWELHIHLDDGTIVRLFDGYDDAELQWMATVLRRALWSSGAQA
jgi:hypothetical protein